MAVGFTHLSRWWLRSGKHKEPKISKAVAASSSNVQSDSTDGRNKASSSSSSSLLSSSFIRRRRRMNERRWRNRKEETEGGGGGGGGGQIDKEYDMVLVQSDSSESDDLDWSIGWLEPHAPEFQGEVDSENSFAVLVPCYRRRHINLDDGGKHQS